MTDLVLDRGLATSSVDDEVRSVARTLTLTTLERLDGARKGAVLRFLYEADLIFGETNFPSPLIDCDERRSGEGEPAQADHVKGDVLLVAHVLGDADQCRLVRGELP
jgi:hypothetical protein